LTHRHDIEPSTHGWLDAFFGRSDARRLALALALSIVVHELIAAFVPGMPGSPPPPPRTPLRVTLLRVERRPPPTPTPRPLHRLGTAPHPVPLPEGASAPRAVHRRVAAAPPKPPHVERPRAAWRAVLGGSGAGAGTRSGAGSPASGGAGSGAGAAGTGGGGTAGSEPCGYVEFQNVGAPRPNPAGGWDVTIEMTVHFPDGRAASTVLDYPWHYATEAADPWSPQNRADPDTPVTMQTPPPSLRASEPPLVQYVLAHTTPQGYTLLKPCPASTP
jgi:hypothetical protein